MSRCSGMTSSQLTTGACQSRDPCEANPCQSTHRSLLFVFIIIIIIVIIIIFICSSNKYHIQCN